MSAINAQVLAALVAALAAFLVSVVNYFSVRTNQKSVEQLKADLADRNARRNARLEYEFDARKKLYQECGPLLFQLSELAERALGRIVGLARTAAKGDLEAHKSWLQRGYYSRSTYYRLLAPLAVARLLRNELTHLDLSVDPGIHWQYALCKQLADTFTDDFDFAKYSPEIEYNPHAIGASEKRAKEPTRFWQQGIPRGVLDNAVSALLCKDGRILDYSEFEAKVQLDDDPVAQSFKRIEYLFASFHPRTRPVLWRMLMAQAHLYRALLVAGEQRPDANLWVNMWGAEHPDLDWRSQEDRPRIEASVVARAFEIGGEYAATRTATTLAKLAAAPQDEA